MNTILEYPATRMDEYKFFNDLCVGVGQWSQNNFGNQGPYRPLLGIIEELSEIGEGLSLMRRADVLDAVGDIVIYMSDYFYRNLTLWKDWGTWDLGKTWSDRGLHRDDTPTMTAILHLVGLLAHHHLKGEQNIRGGTETHQLAVRDACGLVLEYCEHVCLMLDTNVVDVVRGTWDRVSKRDWKKNPDKAHEVAEATPEVAVAVANLEGITSLSIDSKAEIVQAGADYVASRMQGGVEDAATDLVK